MGLVLFLFQNRECVHDVINRSALEIHFLEVLEERSRQIMNFCIAAHSKGGLRFLRDLLQLHLQILDLVDVSVDLLGNLCVFLGIVDVPAVVFRRLVKIFLQSAKKPTPVSLTTTTKRAELFAADSSTGGRSPC